MNEINIDGLKSMKQKCHECSNRDVPSPSLVLLLKAPFDKNEDKKQSQNSNPITVDINTYTDFSSHNHKGKLRQYPKLQLNYLRYQSTLTQIFDTDFLNCNTYTDFSSHYHKGELLQY